MDVQCIVSTLSVRDRTRLDSRGCPCVHCNYAQLAWHHQHVHPAVIDDSVLSSGFPVRAGVVPFLMKALGLQWEVSENACQLLKTMVREDSMMSGILGRMQAPLHVSKVLTLKHVMVPDLKGSWSGDFLCSGLNTPQSALCSQHWVLKYSALSTLGLCTLHSALYTQPLAISTLHFQTRAWHDGT